MAELKNDLVKLAVDRYKNRTSGSYSKTEVLDALREGFVQLNGGSTKLNYKKLRRNKVEIFEIIEEILEKTVIEGLPDDNFFTNFVDDRNLKLGDQNSFYVPDNSILSVSEISSGTTGLRRQRMDVGSNISITTSIKGIKIYEELDRLLSGRVDFDQFMTALEKAFRQKINDDTYDTFTNVFASLPATFTEGGSYNENTLIDLVDHVEAATGRDAMIAGTRRALAKITISDAAQSDKAKEDKYNLSYYGSFYGTPVMGIKQVHSVGGYSFKLSQTDIYIITGEEKPVKFVTEGDVTILDGNPMDNADLTQDYFFSSKYGTGVVITDLFGKYSISS